MRKSESVGSPSAQKRSVSFNRRAMFELIHQYEHGIESAIQAQTSLYHISVVFEGTRAYTNGHTITLPNVRVFATHDHITDEEVEEARAYFMALRGYAWQQAARIVESDLKWLTEWRKLHGSFALALHLALDDIRIEHRFGQTGEGVAEALKYMREMWLWPRFARRKARGEVFDVLHEMLVGLQCTLKHYEARHDHVLWQALEPEVKSWVERSIDELDIAHDTLKMGRIVGTQRLAECSEKLLARWGAEYDLIEPLVPKKVHPVEHDLSAKAAVNQREEDFFDQIQEHLKKNHDELVGKKNEVDDVSQLLTSAIKPPLLLVTVGPRVTTLASTKFAGGYVQRAEAVPSSKEEWDALPKLGPGETRTLVLHPPDPKVEKALDEAMGRLFYSLGQVQREVREKAQQAVDDAIKHIERLPEDQRQYLVYSTANDQYVITPEGSPSELKRMRDDVMSYVSIVKQRLQSLLRSRTRTKWRGGRLEGLELDHDALADVALGKVMPNAELRMFRDRVVQEDVSETLCMLLVDCSGSMAGTKLKLARHSALCFAEALNLAKIKFGMAAFSSHSGKWYELYDKASETDKELYGRFGALYIETCKRFDESWEATANRVPRLGANCDANYDADSVQWAAKQLLSQRAARRVLFVFSDGLPASDEPELQQGRQQRHLGEVVRAVAAQGVETVGFGICDSSVRYYYPHHVVVHSAQDLPKVVMGQMEFLLLNARKR